MQHLSTLDGVYLHRSWLAIGSFDGVHLGHQAIVRQLVSGARQAEAPTVVLTFHPHPAVVLHKREHPYYLTVPEERAALLGELGVDYVVTHPFNSEIAAMSAYQFVQYIHTHLKFERLVVGQNFALGKAREGNLPVLMRLGEEFGFAVQAINPITNGETVISSSQIRALIFAGDVERASRLLGRPFRLSGRVVPGDSRGRLLGIPTANLDLQFDRALPKTGVYACLASVSNQSYRAVVNVGVRPTFNVDPIRPQVEAHLLDFSGDLYGAHLTLDFIQRLRDEQKFPSVEALISQIHQDIASTRTILSQ